MYNRGNLIYSSGLDANVLILNDKDSRFIEVLTDKAGVLVISKNANTDKLLAKRLKFHDRLKFFQRLTKGM